MVINVGRAGAANLDVIQEVEQLGVARDVERLVVVVNGGSGWLMVVNG